MLYPDAPRTEVFAWYTLAGSLATAIGALCGGTLTHALQKSAIVPVVSYRVVVICYAALGAMLALIFTRLSPAAEVSAPGEQSAPGTLKSFWGLGRSHRVVAKLATLFALDSFAGGFVVQSFAAYWFYLRFGVDPGTLGIIFFWANIFCGEYHPCWRPGLPPASALINTMVATHLPSNILLILVPLMPNLKLAVMVLLVRFSISQMDVPTRQSYTMGRGQPIRAIGSCWK